MVTAIKLWSDTVPGKSNGEKASIQEVVFSPDGSKVLVCVGPRVLIYDADDGNLRHSLKGHNETVYSISYASDGKHFASGGADNCVIIWTDEGKGVVKYSHDDSVQVVAYNPNSDVLASCTNSEFGFYFAKKKHVAKFKLESKALAAAWSSDGEILALGMISGTVSLRDKEGDEICCFARQASVWALAWAPCSNLNGSVDDVLAVGCWDKTVSFYTPTGVQLHDACKLDYNPCCISYIGEGGAYVLIGGSGKEVTMCTRDGIILRRSMSSVNDWIWSIKARPRHNEYAVGDHGGGISLVKLQIDLVHGTSGDRCVYREPSLTSLVVRNLASESQIQIKCSDYVKSVSIHRDKVAVQLSDRLKVYELIEHNDTTSISYRVIEEMGKELGFDLFVVSSHCIFSSDGKNLRARNFKGTCLGEWAFDAAIRFMKADGIESCDAVIVGLDDGNASKVFVNNVSPVPLVHHTSGIRSLGINADRSKLAAIDDAHRLFVYDVQTREVIFTENNISSASFNTKNDMICYSGGGKLAIWTGGTVVHSQRSHDLILAFRAMDVCFLVGNNAISTLSVSSAPIVAVHVERNNFQHAYAAACSGVPDSVWKNLAVDAVDAKEFDVARKAFRRVHNFGCVKLLSRVEDRLKQCAGDASATASLVMVVKAEISAHNGEYEKAAKLFKRAGAADKAVDMFLDLRMWEQAKECSVGTKSKDSNDIVSMEAEWAEKTNDGKKAVELYLQSNNKIRAVDVIGNRKVKGWRRAMLDIVHKVPKTDVEVLKKCASFFVDAKDDTCAKEVYLKLEDFSQLMNMHVRRREWAEAAVIFEQHEDVFDNSDFSLPFAEWLAMEGRFDEALDIYRRIGQTRECRRIIHTLAKDAVAGERFGDVSHYFWLLGTALLNATDMVRRRCLNRVWKKHNMLKPLSFRCDQQNEFCFCAVKFCVLNPKESSSVKQDRIIESQQALKISDSYFAYQHIHRFCKEPFTDLQPSVLVNACLFLLNSMDHSNIPNGISKVTILYTLAKQSGALNATKLSCHAYNLLQECKIPATWQSVEIETLTMQATPMANNSDLHPVCYRCGSTNPALAPNRTKHDGSSDICTQCRHPFIRCFINFDVLPLVEFVPDSTVSDAIDLIGRGQSRRSVVKGSRSDIDDLFDAAVNSTLEYQQGSKEYICVTLNEDALRGLRRDTIYASTPIVPGMATRFFKNVIPDIRVAFSRESQTFFHESDYELAFLKNKKRCPITRLEQVDEHGTILFKQYGSI